MTLVILVCVIRGWQLHSTDVGSNNGMHSKLAPSLDVNQKSCWSMNVCYSNHDWIQFKAWNCSQGKIYVDLYKQKFTTDVTYVILTMQPEL